MSNKKVDLPGLPSSKSPYTMLQRPASSPGKQVDAEINFVERFRRMMNETSSSSSPAPKKKHEVHRHDGHTPSTTVAKEPDQPVVQHKKKEKEHTSSLHRRGSKEGKRRHSAKEEASTHPPQNGMEPHPVHNSSSNEHNNTIEMSLPSIHKRNQVVGMVSGHDDDEDDEEGDCLLDENGMVRVPSFSSSETEWRERELSRGSAGALTSQENVVSTKKNSSSLGHGDATVNLSFMEGDELLIPKGHDGSKEVSGASHNSPSASHLESSAGTAAMGSASKNITVTAATPPTRQHGPEVISEETQHHDDDGCGDDIVEVLDTDGVRGSVSAAASAAASTAGRSQEQHGQSQPQEDRKGAQEIGDDKIIDFIPPQRPEDQVSSQQQHLSRCIDEVIDSLQKPQDLSEENKKKLKSLANATKSLRSLPVPSERPGGFDHSSTEGSFVGSSQNNSVRFSAGAKELWGGTASANGSGTTLSTSTALTCFISNLAMKSFQLSRSDEAIVVPLERHAAVMFVDLSGYSKVAKALEQKGAVALHDAVNQYLAIVVDFITSEFGGEIVKFAGDAVMAVWYNGSIAAKATHCATFLQRFHGSHGIQGSKLKFGLHIGIVMGNITSSVLVAEHARNMQQNYHLITGQPLKDIGHIVDAAKIGEVCVSQTVVDNLCRGAVVTQVTDHAFRLDTMRSDCCSHSELRNVSGSDDDDDERSGSWESHMESDGDDDDVVEDFENRLDNMKHFIHFKLRERQRSGLRHSQMAELRLLAVLFIHKTEQDLTVQDWFQEVQQTLDAFRCPIVQIIDDDKGIHMVAALNLFFADREPAVSAIRLAKTLQDKEAGCTVGVACGMTFCGVIGSSAAARWDIVGATCVRACRLMQYGVTHGEPVVIGQSVLQYADDASLTEFFGRTTFKGEDKEISLFRIAPVDTRVLSCITSATRTCSSVHVAQFNLLQRLVINEGKQRCASIIHGGQDSGKTFLAVRAVHGMGIVPFLHVATTGDPTLSVIDTIGTWFSHHMNQRVKEKAIVVQSAFKTGHVLKCIRLGLELIKTMVEEGLKFAFVVRQAQCLDPPSMSFLIQSVQKLSEGSGRWILFLTVVPQNGLPTWKSISEKFEAQGVNPVHAEVGRLTQLEATSLAEHRFGWRCDQDVIDAIVSASARVAGFIDKIITFFEETNLGTISSRGIVRSTRANLAILKVRPWNDISPSVCTKASQLVDALPTSSKTLLKVVSALKTPFNMFVPKWLVASIVCRLVASALPDKITRDLAVLIDLNLLDHSVIDSESHVDFTTPSVADITSTITLGAQRKQVNELAVELVVPDNCKSLVSKLDLAFYNAEAGRQAIAERLYASCASSILATKDYSLIDTVAHQIKALKLHVPTITQFEIPPLAQDAEAMPAQVVALNRFRPPFSLGGLTHAWRQSAVALRTLAVAAATNSTVAADYLVETQTVVRGYCRMVKIVDKHVGYKCPIDEMGTLLGWLQNAPFSVICDRATKFFEYFETVLMPRIQASHEHFRKCQCLPPMPHGKKPFWMGPPRVGMQRALEAVIAEWDNSEAAAARDGMMIMATQGWIPKNPDQTLEFQRDSYFKLLTNPLVCFPSLLYVNLCLFWDE